MSHEIAADRLRRRCPPVPDGTAAALARLPHNRAPHQAAGLDATLDALQG
nr:hypothetical protein [Streptomyces sp. FT05W]